MKKFPKFLKVMPEFFGLGPIEIVGLVFCLYLSMFFNFTTTVSLVFCFVSIGCIKIFKNYVDLVGWILPRRKEIFISELKEENE